MILKSRIGTIQKSDSQSDEETFALGMMKGKKFKLYQDVIAWIIMKLILLKERLSALLAYHNRHEHAEQPEEEIVEEELAEEGRIKYF